VLDSLTPWLLDLCSLQCLNAMLAVLLNLRFGGFNNHSPRTGKFAYGSTGSLLLWLAEHNLRRQEETARLARFDPLTRLNNREGIRQHGQSLIEQGFQPCVLMLNIERLKAINETLGVAFGDQILIAKGHRRRRLVARCPGSRAGRMHADQFCLFYPLELCDYQLTRVLVTPSRSMDRPSTLPWPAVLLGSAPARWTWHSCCATPKLPST
jgi:predicted signal transduction protein with EAL and GGDEF domain